MEDEFSKIRNAFVKVKGEMDGFKEKILKLHEENRYLYAKIENIDENEKFLKNGMSSHSISKFDGNGNYDHSIEDTTKLMDLQNEVKNHSNETRELESQKLSLVRNLSVKKNEIESYRKENLDLQDKDNKREVENKNFIEKIKYYENDIITLTKKNDELKEDKNTNLSKIDELSLYVGGLENKHRIQNEEIGRYEKENLQFLEIEKHRKEEIEKSREKSYSLDKELREIKLKYEETQDLYYNSSENLKTETNSNSNFKKEVSNLKKEINLLETISSKLEDNNKELSAELRITNDGLKKISKDFKNIKKDHSDKYVDLVNLKSLNSEIENKLIKTNSDLTYLKKDYESLEKLKNEVEELNVNHKEKIYSFESKELISKDEIKALKRDIKDIKENKDKYEKKSKKTQDENVKLSMEANEVNEQLRKVEEEGMHLQGDLTEAEITSEQAQEEVNKLKTDILDYDSKVVVLEKNKKELIDENKKLKIEFDKAKLINAKVGQNVFEEVELTKLKLIGNIDSRVVHYSNSQFAEKISKDKRVEFNSLEEADKAGYSRSHSCKKKLESQKEIDKLLVDLQKMFKLDLSHINEIEAKITEDRLKKEKEFLKNKK